MARIRSIHPGLFSDPEFADLSSDAQVFYLGILTEADDNGVFEWKPSTLRIRLRPLKDGGVEPILAELEAAGKVQHYEMNGRKYGAIRNFRKFQRPKSPKSWHPMPDDFRNWVGLTRSTSEIGQDEPENDAGHSASAGEIRPQMEDGGGRREEEDVVPASKNLCVSQDARERATHTQPLREWDDWKPSEQAVTTLRTMMPWLTGDLFDSRMQDFREWCRANAIHSFSPDDTWSSFMRKTHEPKAPVVGSKAPKSDGLPPAPPWAARMKGWRERKFWPGDWGPKPGEPGCWVPREFLDTSPRYSATEAA